MNHIEEAIKTGDIGIIIQIIKLTAIIIVTYYVFGKMTNIKKMSIKEKIVIIVSALLIAIISKIIEIKVDLFYKWIVIIGVMGIVNKKCLKKEWSYTIVMTIISASISYAIYTIAVIIMFLPNVIIKIENDYINLVLILIIYVIMVYRIFKIKKLKYGISFIQKKVENTYYSMLMMNIGIIVMFINILRKEISRVGMRKASGIFVILVIAMIITIKQSFEIYYKKSQLEKELEHTKEKLEKVTKENMETNKKYVELSKTKHSQDHEQKILKYKIEKLMKRKNIKEEEKEQIKEEEERLAREIYEEPEGMEIEQTGIEEIDDTLGCMKEECRKNKIEFELRIEDGINYMIHHLIEKEELKMILADHIKDAIIAINSSENEYRNIFVRIGKINGIYGIYIYDTGIEFEKDVLEKLGKEAITTHKDSGGTGMGFLNTFDVLRKHRASLEIEEIGKPCIDNYTKILKIKFDNKNDFRVEKSLIAK